MRRLVVATALAAISGCVSPVMVGNAFTPADELRKGTFQASFETDIARRLDASPAAPEDPDFDRHWIASDLALRYGITDELGAELAVKSSWVLPFPIPLPIGVQAGAHWRFHTEEGLALALRPSLFTAGLPKSGENASGSSSTFWGGTLQLPLTWRPAEFFSLTATPYARFLAYDLRKDRGSTVSTALRGQTVSGGLSASSQLRLAFLELALAFGFEAYNHPVSRQIELAPLLGIAAGLRF